MNYTLLIIGLVRSSIWILGAIVAYQRKLPLAFAGMAIIAAISVVFSFVNAGAELSSWVTAALIAITAPAAGMLVLSVANRARQATWRG